jgi:hypothetical protein
MAVENEKGQSSRPLNRRIFVCVRTISTRKTRIIANMVIGNSRHVSEKP